MISGGSGGSGGCDRTLGVVTDRPASQQPVWPDGAVLDEVVLLDVKPEALKRVSFAWPKGQSTIDVQGPKGKLRQALQGERDGWYEVEATDGAVLVDLGQVTYLRVESGEHRVGF